MVKLIKQTKRPIRCGCNGFSTLEMLLAMAILILTLTAVISVSFGSQSMVTDSQVEGEALGIAQQMLEKAQADARKDFNLVVPYNATTTSDGMQYRQDLAVETQPNFLTKKVTAIVSWTGERGRALNSSLSALVTNFNNAVGGDTCDSVLKGDWTSPQTKNSTVDFGRIIGDLSGKYDITDVDAYMGKLYVTCSNGSETPLFKGAQTGMDGVEVGALAWSNPGAISEIDGLNAAVSLNGTNVSHYLKATNFGFDIPPGATVLGVKVDIFRSTNGYSAGNAAVDDRVSLVRPDGSLGSKNKAGTAGWAAGGTVDAAYGGNSDLWEEASLSAADINDPGFGVAFAVKGNSSTSNRVAYVDSVQITVTYIKSFYVLDIADPANPVFYAGLANNPGIAGGFNAVATDGKFAYVAANSSNNQLQVIDLSGAVPTVKYTYKIPGVSGAAAKAIFYKDGYVYLGLEKTAGGPEFNIIDVHNPAISFPFVVGSGYSVGYDINAIYVRDGYAYLAHPTDSGAAIPEQLTVLRVRDPSDIERVSGYNAPDNQGNGKSFYLVGNNLYFGRTETTSANREFYILDDSSAAGIDAANPNGPEPAGSKINSSVSGLIVRDRLAYLLTTKQAADPGQFQILNIVDRANITAYAPPVKLPDAGAASQDTGSGVAMDCEGNYLYVASRDYTDSTGNIVNTGYLSIITGQ